MLHYYIYDTCTFVDIIASFFLCMLAFYIWLIVLYFALSMFIYTHCAFCLTCLLAYFQCHINVFIIFLSLSIPTLVCSFLSFHFFTLCLLHKSRIFNAAFCVLLLCFSSPFSATYFILLFFFSVLPCLC